MGRTCVVFDGPGWKYCSEPGADFEFSARVLLEKIRSDWQKENPGTAAPFDGFWIPPGSDSVLNYPLQLLPSWRNDARTASTRFPSSAYEFTQLLTADPSSFLKEWNPTKAPDGTKLENEKWLTYSQIINVSLTNQIDFELMGDETKISFPEMVEAWEVTKAPDGLGLNSTGRFPFLRFYQYPDPYGPLVFTFCNYFIVFLPAEVIMLRRDPAFDVGFVTLGRWALPTEKRSWLVDAGDAAIGLPVVWHAQPRTFAVVPFGERFFYVWTGSGQPTLVEAVPHEHADRFLEPGLYGWSMHCPNNTRLTWDLQQMWFSSGDTDVYSDPQTPDLFNLTEEYGLEGGPTIDPAIFVSGAIPRIPEDPTDVPSVTQTTNEYDFSAAVSGSRLLVQLRDSDDNLWDSDGTHWSGNVRILADPAQATSIQFTYPTQIDVILFKFPRKLTDRANTGLTLLDTQFREYEAETEVPNLAKQGNHDKRVVVDVWDDGLELFIAAGLDEREGYPVEIYEDVDNDNIYETRRIAGWIDHPDMEEHHIKSVGGKSINFYRINGKSVMSRADFPWIYQPMITDPFASDGTLEHTKAVEIVIGQMGFDETEISQVFIQEDQFAGTLTSRLPGNWSDPVLPVERKSRWAPELDETMPDWITRIGRTWRGWVFYEDLTGRVLYHNELLWELNLGKGYFRSATVYRSAAEALAAGAPRTQTYRQLSRKYLQPVKANVVKCYAKRKKKDLTEESFTVVVRDPDSYGDDPDVENFVGQPRVEVIYPEMAFGDQDVGEAIAGQFAAAELSISKMRKVFRSFQLNMPLWDLTPDEVVGVPPDVGYVLRFMGKGDYVIYHHTVKEEIGSYRSSVVTCVKLPTPAVLKAGGDILYPGRMDDV